ncbi:hypothetical protein AS593_22240 [Caulobacter vibrioides]|nr:hypothetical protein AS593_22240 [Caulobacter vibrioides]
MSALIFEIVWCAAFSLVGVLLLARPRELFVFVRRLFYGDAALSDRGAGLIGPSRWLGLLFALVGIPLAVARLFALATLLA